MSEGLTVDERLSKCRSTKARLDLAFGGDLFFLGVLLSGERESKQGEIGSSINVAVQASPRGLAGCARRGTACLRRRRTSSGDRRRAAGAGGVRPS